MAAFTDAFLKNVTEYDSYEWRARFAVGGIIAIPTVVAIAFFAESRTLPQMLLAAAVLEVLFAMLLAQVVRSLGHSWAHSRKGAQPKEIVVNTLADVPVDAGPRIVSSSDQLGQWRSGIAERLHLDLAAESDFDKRKAMAEDAYTRMTYLLRDPDSGATPFLQKHTIEYGFARNLAGSWNLWLVTSFIFTFGLAWYSMQEPLALFGMWVQLGFFVFGIATYNAIEEAVPDAAMHLASVTLCAWVDCKPSEEEPEKKPEGRAAASMPDLSI